MNLRFYDEKGNFVNFYETYIVKNHNEFFFKKLLEIDLKVWLRLNLFLQVIWVIHFQELQVFISLQKNLFQSPRNRKDFVKHRNKKFSKWN